LLVPTALAVLVFLIRKIVDHRCHPSIQVDHVSVLFRDLGIAAVAKCITDVEEHVVADRLNLFSLDIMSETVIVVDVIPVLFSS